MRFDKGNCRKKRVFSQPDVPVLGPVLPFSAALGLARVVCCFYSMQYNKKSLQLVEINLDK